MAEELLGIDPVKNDQIRNKNKRAEGALVFVSILYLWTKGELSRSEKGGNKINFTELNNHLTSLNLWLIREKFI